MENEAFIAKLNDVADILGQLDTGKLREIINLGRSKFNPVAGCDSECGCRGGMCGCNGVVSSNTRFDVISLPEFMELRNARLNELKKEMARLELK